MRAFTFIELLIVVVIVAIVTGLALIPAASLDGPQAASAGRQVSAMFEYAQHLAITRSDQTYVVKADPTGNRIWIATQSAPDTPVANPVTRKPYVIQFGNGSTEGLTSVKLTGTDMGGDHVLAFDSSGGVDQSAPAAVKISVGGKPFTIALSPQSGIVKLIQGDLLEAQTATLLGDEADAGTVGGTPGDVTEGLPGGTKVQKTGGLGGS